MAPITFNRKIILETHERQYGHSMKDTVRQKTVWANVSLPSMTMKSNAQSAGVAIDLIVHCYRKEYEAFNPTYAVINGVRYKVTSVGTSVNDLFVKLALARG